MVLFRLVDAQLVDRNRRCLEKNFCSQVGKVDELISMWARRASTVARLRRNNSYWFQYVNLFVEGGAFIGIQLTEIFFQCKLGSAVASLSKPYFAEINDGALMISNKRTVLDGRWFLLKPVTGAGLK